MHRVGRVESEVELEDIHAGFAEKSELPTGRVAPHQRAHLLLAHSALAGHARDLKFRRRGRDVRIEARTRRRYEIHGNGSPGIFGAQPPHALFHARDQNGVCGTKI